MSRHRTAPTAGDHSRTCTELSAAPAHRFTSTDRTMAKNLAATFIALAAFGASAQTSLAPADKRIADSTIQADHKSFEALQARI